MLFDFDVNQESHPAFMNKGKVADIGVEYEHCSLVEY